MNITELKTGFTLFGNGGNAVTNTCHIYHAGDNTTLCGVPPLSRNWGAINEVKEIGCKDCLEIYNVLTLTTS
jgi:hypothetical protein